MQISRQEIGKGLVEHVYVQHNKILMKHSRKCLGRKVKVIERRNSCYSYLLLYQSIKLVSIILDKILSAKVVTFVQSNLQTSQKTAFSI